jgi:predicted dehydrogenase
LNKINLGIIGLGNQGKIHLRNCIHLENVIVKGVADISKKNLDFARKLGIKNAYTDYENMLRDEQITAVIISLPNFLHLEASLKAAEAGKHVFIEKPMGRNVRECREILSAFRKNDLKLMVGYGLRFHPVVKRIREKIMDGFFGEVQIVESTYVSGGPFSPKSSRAGPVPVPSWWFDKELAGGGSLLDLGSHMIDLLLWFFEEVKDVESYINYTFNLEIEDVATCVLKFKKGPLAIVNAGWFSKDFTRSIQICGTAKNLWFNLSRSSVVKEILKDVKKKFGWYSSDPYYLELAHFINCLQKDEEPNPSGEDGLRCHEVICWAYRKAFEKIKN